MEGFLEEAASAVTHENGIRKRWSPPAPSSPRTHVIALSEMEAEGPRGSPPTCALPSPSILEGQDPGTSLRRANPGVC